MNITDIFGDPIKVTDLNAAIEQSNLNLGFARKAFVQTGYPNVKFKEKNGVEHTLVAYHSHMLKALLELMPPIAKPEWLFVGTFPACYWYCDKRKEVRGDYKTVLRLFYNPLRIEISASNQKAYPEILELAKQELKRLQMRVNEPLIVSASGQTTELALSTGPDVVIVKH